MIKVTHNYYYEPDFLGTNLKQLIVEINENKERIIYDYVSHFTGKEKVIEKELESNIYEEINKIDISNLEDNYFEETERDTSWEIEKDNKKILGNYTKIPYEVFKIMEIINMDSLLDPDGLEE